MSKLPPKNFFYHKKAQRLFFPRNDDPSLFSNVGRKHYVNKISFSPPYAQFRDTKQSQHVRYDNKSHVQLPRIRQKSNQEQKLKFLNFQNYQSASKETLETQVDRFRYYNPSRGHLERQSAFNIKQKAYRPQQRSQQYRSLEKPSYSSQNPIRPSRMRIRTEAQASYNPQEDHYVKKPQIRFRTQSNQPDLGVKSHCRVIRFNPTFMSSVNC